MKDKRTATMLALFLGGLGTHRFYLGQTILGLVYFVFCLTFVPLLISLVDAFLLWKMSDEDFNKKYNKDAAVAATAQKANAISLVFDTPDNEVPHELQTEFNELLNAITEDGMISPEEESQLLRLVEKSGGKLQMGDVARGIFNRMKKSWQIENGDLDIVNTTYAIPKTELCHFQADCSLFERKTITTRINYAGVGMRVKIAKGLYYKMGTISPQRIQRESIVLVDSGTVLLTNKRLLFVGQKANKSFNYRDILGLIPYSDGVEIQKDKGKNVIVSPTNELDIFYLMLDRLIRE